MNLLVHFLFSDVLPAYMHTKRNIIYGGGPSRYIFLSFKSDTRLASLFLYNPLSIFNVNFYKCSPSTYPLLLSLICAIPGCHRNND